MIKEKKIVLGTIYISIIEYIDKSKELFVPFLVDELLFNEWLLKQKYEIELIAQGEHGKYYILKTK